MSLLHYYRSPGLTAEQKKVLRRRIQEVVSCEIGSIDTEYCFNLELEAPLSIREEITLVWLLSETFEPQFFSRQSFLPQAAVLEVGPRLSFNTAWCTNAVQVFHACGLRQIKRIERSRRYRIHSPRELTRNENNGILELVHDRMTEVPYPGPLSTFHSGTQPEPVFEVPVLQEGRRALERINREAGLAFDDWDLDYYTRLFAEDLGRNPTNVECFDIAQSNSEHSRHWFFKGRLIIDGREMPKSLLRLVQEPLLINPNNSTIAFKDNSSAIRGYPVRTILPGKPGEPSPFDEALVNYDIIFTAETHNFPSGVAPFPGAETGTGGRIRDVQATGRGGLVVAGTAAYCVGNLKIPGYELPWEDKDFLYPKNLATALEIELEASNGASDYGNKFGEPVIQGFTRALGLRLPNGERREWIKPIMFSGGLGQLDSRHRQKYEPETGMWVVKIGGPAYRIGMGGGAASSMVHGENVAELDFNAVQRGDAEMEQKVNRVIRACVELGPENPIVSIHDQGAGGNCNVIKEIVHPAGARIKVRKIPVGDETLSVLEIWGAEYQEQDALLLRPEHASVFSDFCRREKVPAAFVGRITGDGRIVLFDELDQSTPVDLDLEKVLGDMPQKQFDIQTVEAGTQELRLPENLGIREALDGVLRLLAVGSKRFLTNKVDRSVTGLIARQQCAGPLQLTVSDVAVVAQSHFGISGAALAIGEQPIIGLCSPAAMARMSVAEALTNIVWAKVSALTDIKCSANWMWAAKLPGEGARLHEAAVALRDVLIQLGIAIDGGKDSLSMAAFAPLPGGGEETVKAPGELVISTYTTCPDITRTVTPDLKLPGQSCLYFADLTLGKVRLGGSALAQVFRQVGREAPDLENPELLIRAFQTVQALLDEGLILAGHDRSDGGLITTLLEMAFSGNCGIDIDLGAEVPDTPLAFLFAEELGLVMEAHPLHENRLLEAFEHACVPCRRIGRPIEGYDVKITGGGEELLRADMRELRDLWEETSYRLELLQANPDCVEQERRGLRERKPPPYSLSFTPRLTTVSRLNGKKPRVAILREEGSNGDREMTSAFFAAGFEPWDITMTDLLNSEIRLENFRGLAFVGGFSYADVLDSAKGWAGVIRFNESVWDQFQDFYRRGDTFSLGVCNGCQLMALLGWVPWPDIPDPEKPRFVHNHSGRFESRFATVRILKSPSVMLQGMEDSTLGVWVAHGEGRAHFPHLDVLREVLRQDLAPLRFVDDEDQITESYPFNPNGSIEGITALCSPDGRHLALMPHPERTFLKWQWGWMPEAWKNDLEAAPWLRMFQNAWNWCCDNRE